MAELINFITKQAHKGFWLLSTLNDIVKGPSLRDVQPKHNTVFQLNAVSIICIMIVGYFLYMLQELVLIVINRKKS